ncbi:MAG TPA: hypothetical protein VHY21_02595 [Pseudonocardiaceae bacterium]|jgi:hypothetical protein|nr:hypothetical protein [Pseudonocardiaceae bacterium]
MRLVVAILGRRVLEVSTDREPSSPAPPSLEATSGGQFEFGFGSMLRPGEVACRGEGG